MKQHFLILLSLLLSPIAARADAVGYGGTHVVTVTQGTLTFRHVHDWDSPKLDALSLDLTHPERFLSAENDFSSVELRDGDRVLFRSPSPALTYLWISPDAQYFVGLSNIMLRNLYQLVIWRRDGTLIHREHISAEVAKLSPEQRREFARRFPKAERFLSGRYFIHGGITYLDYLIGGTPNEIGHEAFMYLIPFNVPHPYSDDFGESVTNWVFWFDDTNPDLSISPDGANLTLRSPTGKRLTILIKE